MILLGSKAPKRNPEAGKAGVQGRRRAPSWKCARRRIFALEHGPEAAARLFGVCDIAILHGKIRRADLGRDNSQFDTPPGPSGCAGVAPKPSRPRVPDRSKPARSVREGDACTVGLV